MQVVANPAVDIRRRDVDSNHITTEQKSPHSTRTNGSRGFRSELLQANGMAMPDDEPLLYSDWQALRERVEPTCSREHVHPSLMGAHI